MKKNIHKVICLILCCMLILLPVTTANANDKNYA